MRELSITVEDGRVYYAQAIVVKWSAHLEQLRTVGTQKAPCCHQDWKSCRFKINSRTGDLSHCRTPAREVISDETYYPFESYPLEGVDAL